MGLWGRTLRRWRLRINDPGLHHWKEFAAMVAIFPVWVKHRRPLRQIEAWLYFVIFSDTVPCARSSRLPVSGFWSHLTTTCFSAKYLGWPAWAGYTRKTFIHLHPVFGYYTTSLINFHHFLHLHSILPAYLWGVKIFFFNLTPSFVWPSSRSYICHCIIHAFFSLIHSHPFLSQPAEVS